MILKVLDKTMGIRVSPEEEDAGLDITEHGELAYETLHKKDDDYHALIHKTVNSHDSIF